MLWYCKKGKEMGQKIVLAVFMLLWSCFSTQAKEFTLAVDSDELLYGVMQRENKPRDPNAVGDKHLPNKAYGLLQIRSLYLADVNKIAGREEIQAVWGKDKLTMQDMKDQVKAEWAFHVYLSHYGKVYTRRTGKIPTAEVYARIHNGGPNGWREYKTINYGKAVVWYIKVYRIGV